MSGRTWKAYGFRGVMVGDLLGMESRPGADLVNRGAARVVSLRGGAR
jgi:hypothetical protein